MSLSLIWAFVRRDLRIAASYPVNFLFILASGLITLTVFYFLAKTIGEPATLQRFGLDYFSFALIGIAIATCLRAMQTSFASRVREAQTDGSLEMLLAAPLLTFQVVGCLAIYPVASAFLRSLALVLCGSFLGAHLALDPLAFVGTLVVSMIPFAALGLISAAFVLVFKRADPFAFALDAASYLLCGVIYPVEVLPPALQWASKLLPATYAIRALRDSGLKSAGVAQVLPAWGALAVFAIVLWPAAAAALAWARRRAERTGTLPQW
ncbi:MAG TPA: ABC transporter permease [Myxococcaceae bacterium]|nr:ABC transporter permease [Myxococcaceae bacterium]